MTRDELKDLACLGFSADLVMQSFCHTAAYPKPVDVVTHAYRPTTVLAWGEAGNGPRWEGRDPSLGRAYVCRDFTCLAPVDSIEALAGELG
jgi:uncharacterized protein YyaL (SSP411 family)